MVDGTFSARQYTSSNLLHSAKALLLTYFTELPMVTEVKLLHPEKAWLPIVVTELGIITEVRPLQAQKA